MKSAGAVLTLCLGMTLSAFSAAEETEVVDVFLETMPEGYQLQACDDCGSPGCQPHVPNGTLFEFPEHAVAAGHRSRTGATDPDAVMARYDGIDSTLDYIVAVTYSSEPMNRREQSLWVNGIEPHAKRALPLGKAERLLMAVPKAAAGAGTWSFISGTKAL